MHLFRTAPDVLTVEFDPARKADWVRARTGFVPSVHAERRARFTNCWGKMHRRPTNDHSFRRYLRSAT